MSSPTDSSYLSLESADTPVEMLVLGCNSSLTNDYANALRNMGQAVHSSMASDLHNLSRSLETEPCNLVLVNCDNEELPRDTVITTIRKFNPAIGIILLSESPTSFIEYATQREVQDVIKIDDVPHVAFAVRREHSRNVLQIEFNQMSQKLEESQDRCSALIQSSRDAIAYIHEGMHIQANPVYLEMFGFDEEEGLDGLPIMDLISKESRDYFKKFLRKQSGKDSSISEEISCINQKGDDFKAVLEFSPGSYDGEPCTQVIIRDQSVHQEMQRKIEELANRDPDTGLYNRKAFMHRLDGLLKSDQKSKLGIVQITISNFSDIRDTIGVAIADRLLKKIGQIIDQKVGDAVHTLARFGDHDFMAASAIGESISAIAQSTLDLLQQTDFGLPKKPQFNLALTIADGEEDITAQELLNRSCQTVKQSKQKGTNQLAKYTRVVDAIDESKSSIDPNFVKRIDDALQDDGFELLYQPIVSLQGDTRENYSVLVRLIDESNKELFPSEFLPHAEESQRMAEIDRWVIRNAIKELVAHRKEGKKINFYIVLSRAGIEDESMLLWICDCLREFKAKGAWLVFQLHERDVRMAMKPAQRFIEGLKKVNCRVAISHYQDNPSCNTIIKRMAIDVVKLSPEYVTNLSKDEKTQNDVTEINEKLQLTGIKTVATGVEDAATVALLWNTGANYIQGNFLQEPSTQIAYDAEEQSAII